MSGERHYVHTVDIARGVAAIGVMVYHLLYGEQIAAYERVAYYCVYAFFVISGFSLYITYRDRLVSLQEIRAYARKRFMRIAPLFYLACLLQLALIGWPANTWTAIPLNLSLAFGFANPGATSMIAGGWSIGIEMVFYLILPAIIILCRGSFKALVALVVVSTWLMVTFVNQTLAGFPTMHGVWPTYTQPIAFFGYFAFGCLVGELYLRNHQLLKGKLYWVAILLGALLPFAFIEVATPTDLLKGKTGLLLMALTTLAVTASAFAPEPRGYLLDAGKWLGRLSYSVYLLHPIVYVGLIVPNFDGSTTRIVLTIVVTFGLAAFVYKFVENPLRIGARLSAST